MSIVGEAVNGIDAIYKAEVLRPDVVLMDAQMPAISNGSGNAAKANMAMPNLRSASELNLV